MNWKQICLTSGLAVLCAGCNVNPINYGERLQTPSNCCFQFADLPAEKLAIQEEPHRFHIGDKYQTAIEDGGQRVFALKLELPEFNEPYIIKLESRVRHNRALVPKLRLIDADGEITRTIDREQFVFNMNKYELSLFINEQQKNERFLLISEDPAARNQTQNTLSVNINTMVLGNGVAFNYGSGDIRNTITSTHGGEIDVKLSAYKLKTLADLQKEKN